MKVCKRAHSITNLLFADDSYLYCKADECETQRMMEILTNFGLASGQKVNKSKSSVFFSSNTGLEKNSKFVRLFIWGKQKSHVLIWGCQT